MAVAQPCNLSRYDCAATGELGDGVKPLEPRTEMVGEWKGHTLLLFQPCLVRNSKVKWSNKRARGSHNRFTLLDTAGRHEHIESSNPPRSAN